MNPSKYKSVCVGIKSWQLATELTTTLLPHAKYSRSQVVEIALNKLATTANVDSRSGVTKKLGDKLKGFLSIKNQLVKLKFPTVLKVVPKTAITKDEIEARNRTIYKHRVIDKDQTLQQLGTMYNLSRERVRQIQEQQEVSAKTLNQPKEKHASNN